MFIILTLCLNNVKMLTSPGGMPTHSRSTAGFCFLLYTYARMYTFEHRAKVKDLQQNKLDRFKDDGRYKYGYDCGRVEEEKMVVETVIGWRIERKQVHGGG